MSYQSYVLSLSGNVLSFGPGNSITLPTSPVFAGSATGTVPVATATDATKVLSGAGTWISVAPPITNLISYDAIGKILTSTVGGVTSTTSLAALDDEGVQLSFSAGTLQLKNSAGTVLSSTPVPDLDAQTLTLTGSTLAISGGNSVTLPAAPPVFAGSATGTVPVATAADVAKVLSGAGTWITVAAAPATTVSNAVAGTGATRTLTTTVNGVTGASVAIPDNDGQTLSITGSTLAISGGNSITLPTSPVFAGSATGTVPVATAADAAKVLSGAGTWIAVAPATTTVSNTVAGSGSTRTLVTTVNGVAAASVAIPDLDAQTLSITGSTVSISGGNSITLPSAPTTTVSNTVAGTGTARTLTTTVNGVTGASVAIPDNDGQTLSITGSTVSISGGNSITLPTSPVFAGSATGTVPVATATDATKVLSGAGTWIAVAPATTTVANTVSGTGTARTITTTVNGVTGVAVAIPDNDGQTLSITGSTVSISGGNSITLPTSPVFAGSATGTVPVATATDAAKVLSGAGTWVAAAPAVTTNVISYNLGTYILTSTVNGIASTTDLSDLAYEAQALTMNSTGRISLSNSSGTPTSVQTTCVHTFTGTGAARTLQTLVNGALSNVIAMPEPVEIISIAEFLNDEFMYTRTGVVSFVVPAALAGWKVTKVNVAAYLAGTVTPTVNVTVRTPGTGAVVATIASVTLPAAGVVEATPTPYTLVAGTIITIDNTSLSGSVPKGLTVTLTATP